MQCIYLKNIYNTYKYIYDTFCKRKYIVKIKNFLILSLSFIYTFFPIIKQYRIYILIHFVYVPNHFVRVSNMFLQILHGNFARVTSYEICKNIVANALLT